MSRASSARSQFANDGVLDLAAFEEALTIDALAAVQAANNETGVLQPLDAIAQITRAKGAALVCDAVQAAGRIPLQYLEKADALILSGHKCGGPKGVGAVLVRDSAFPLHPLIRGGGQERRHRSGTENVAGIAGMAAALEASIEEQGGFATHAAALQAKLESGLRSVAPEAAVFGAATNRLPNTTYFAIPGRSAEMSLIAFDLEGVAVSSGSACSSGKVERSHVLGAMGVDMRLGSGAIRVSTGWTTTEADIDRFLTVLERICGAGKARQAA